MFNNFLKRLTILVPSWPRFKKKKADFSTFFLKLDTISHDSEKNSYQNTSIIILF